MLTSINTDRQKRIAELAYYKSERRGFEPGHALEDWIQAEREVLISENTQSYRPEKTVGVENIDANSIL